MATCISAAEIRLVGHKFQKWDRNVSIFKLSNDGECSTQISTPNPESANCHTFPFSVTIKRYMKRSNVIDSVALEAEFLICC